MAATFQCDQSLKGCECAPFPVRNFTSERLDAPVFLSNVDFIGEPGINQWFGQIGCLGQCESVISQEDADLCALRAGQDCAWGSWSYPGIPVTGGRLPNPRFIFRNTEQSCESVCPDGASIIETVPAGQIQSIYSQAEADALAYSLACKRADSNRLCFITTAVAPGCLNELYSFVFDVEGGKAPYSFVLASGFLPDGLELNALGGLIGLPTAPGFFTFTITATDDNDRTVTKSFTMQVQECVAALCPGGTPALVPSDLGIADNTVIGTAVIPDITVLGGTASFGLMTIPVGEYRLDYLSGCYSYTSVVALTTSGYVPPCSTATTYTTRGHVADLIGAFGTITVGLNQNDAGSNQAFLIPATQDRWTVLFGPAGCTPQAADCSFVHGLPASSQYFQGNEVKLRYDGMGDFYGMTSARTNGAPNPTWQLTRTRKPALAPLPDRLRIANYVAIKDALIGCDSTQTDVVSPEWDGTFTILDATQVFANWIWEADLAANRRIANKRLDYSAAQHVVGGMPTVNGNAWLLTVGLALLGIPTWTGIGGDGIDPRGVYYFNPDIAGWLVCDQKAAVKGALLSPLPSNVRTGNVLNPISNGPFQPLAGVTFSAGDRMLIAGELLPENNGIYTVTALGSATTKWQLTRAIDADTDAEMTQGIFVKETSGGCYYRLTTLAPIILNTTVLTWTAIPMTMNVESY